MRSVIIVQCAILLLAGAADAAGLAAPVPVQVNGRPVDVEHLGHSAACLGDIDGDGRRDLLVGEFFRGRLSIYRNIGTDSAPSFDEPMLFQDGAPSGCIHASCCMGFGPQFVDFNGDGLEDVLTGDWLHQVILFARQTDGSFAAGAPVVHVGGDPLKFDYGVHAHAVDWDADGDLDLLAGTVPDVPEGNVWLALNRGTAAKPEFTDPVRLQAAGVPIVATKGGAAPVAADWDADGDLDLILGCGDGSVIWYPNTGARNSPAFGASQLLLAAPTESEERGTHATPCVTDFNQDGRLDLLIGDVGDSFPKELSPLEVAYRDSARKEQGEILTQWSQAFARFRQLKASDAAASAVESTRQEMVRLKKVHEQCIYQEEAFQSGRQRHGRIWLLLGQE